MIGHVPDEASPLVQVIRGSEREHGVHAIILRQPVSESRVLERLGLAADKLVERRAGVYVQITRPGEPFISFHLAQRKFFLPLWFYLELLDFFAPAGQYFCIRERIQRDIANLLHLREPVNLGVVTGFYHHGKIRYLFPYKCIASNIDQLPVDTIFIWITVDSKSPEGTEPECWISSSPEKQEHQIPIAPFLEFAKYAPHELKPLLPPNLRANDNNEIPFVAAAAAAAEVINDMSAPVVVIDAAAAMEPPPSPGTPIEEEDVPYDASAAMDRLERICSEVALKIREPQQQQQRESPARHPSKSSSGGNNDDASGRKRGASSSSRGGQSSGSNKKERNPYLSPTSTVSSSSAASSRSSSVNRSSQKGGRSHGYFTSGGGGGGSGSGHNDRYKDHPDAKRSRQ
jgi:hypothetical protein